MPSLWGGAVAGLAFVVGIIGGVAVTGDGFMPDPMECGTQVFEAHAVTYHGPLDDEGWSEAYGDFKRAGWTNIQSNWTYGSYGTIEAECLAEWQPVEEAE